MSAAVKLHGGGMPGNEVLYTLSASQAERPLMHVVRYFWVCRFGAGSRSSSALGFYLHSGMIGVNVKVVFIARS
jgi:hypothetical protein